MVDPVDYAWIESVFGDGACVTATAGATTDSVLTAFGADTSMIVEGIEAYGGGGLYPAVVSAASVPGGIIAVEFNGYQGSVPSVLARLSEYAPTASIYWNVNDDNAFSCARGGEILAKVDMYSAANPDVELPSELAMLFGLATDEDADLWPIGFAMVELFTGVVVPQDVTSNLIAHPIPIHF